MHDPQLDHKHTKATRILLKQPGELQQGFHMLALTPVWKHLDGKEIQSDSGLLTQGQDRDTAPTGMIKLHSWVYHHTEEREGQKQSTK